MPVESSAPLPADDQPLYTEVFPTVPLRVKITNLLAVVLPFAGLVAGAILFWGWGFDWLHLGLMLGMYLISILGVTVGYHRLFTHRSFRTYKPVQVILAIAGSMAVEGPVIKWVAMHRRHHQRSDHEGDPHSPHLHGSGIIGMLKGFCHAHVGWMFKPDMPNIMNGVKDLLADPAIRRVDRFFAVWVALGLLAPAALGWILSHSWQGALLGFIWGGLVRIFLVHHVTFSVNSICHIWGSRPFQSNDHSTNNLLFAILGMGEGWHNNHHAFPTSACHGLRWWQIDFSYYVIKLMSWVGLAWDVRKPSAAAMEAKKAV
jgi:stearoyl-CoA desaturase (delta-9 desaturase)